MHTFWSLATLALLVLCFGSLRARAGTPVQSPTISPAPIFTRAMVPAEPCRGQTVASAVPTPPYVAISICAERTPSTAPGGSVTSYSLLVRTANGWFSADLGEDGVVGGFDHYFRRSFGDPQLALAQVVPGGAPEIVIHFSDGGEWLQVCGTGPSAKLSCASAVNIGDRRRGRWSYQPASHTSEYLVGRKIIYRQVILFP